MKNRIHCFKIGCCLLLFSLFASCSKTKEEKEEVIKNRTVLVYLGVDNNFSSEAKEKIDILRESWQEEYDGNLLIYADPGGSARLVRIFRDKQGVNRIDTVNLYPSENSASPEVFQRVLEDVRTEYPAESYGLVVLSHGTGWLPKGTMQTPRSIIMDKTNEMEIRDFAQAIPYHLDFIIFDACMMGGVEVVYELKEVADYLLVSPAEVLQRPGFSYATMMKHLMKKEADVVAVAKEFFEIFDKESGLSRSATVSVIKTSELDQLADRSAALLKGIDGESLVDISKLQNFGYGKNALYIDFGDYIKALAPDRYTEFMEALEKCIVYKDHTPNYYSGYRGVVSPINAYSGLSIYIKQNAFPIINAEYDKLKWSLRINN